MFRRMPPQRFRLFLLAPAVLLLLAGCPYGSEFPLGSPQQGVRDDALLGAWKPAAESEEDFTLTFRSAGGADLSVLAESPDEEPAGYPAFVSEVGGRRFLNLRDDEDSGRWYFANYRLHEGRLQLRLVDDELIGARTFPSAEELRAFLQDNLEDPRLYGGHSAEEWDWELERQGP
jgi:hypothetical protein